MIKIRTDIMIHEVHTNEKLPVLDRDHIECISLSGIELDYLVDKIPQFVDRPIHHFYPPYINDVMEVLEEMKGPSGAWGSTMFKSAIYGPLVTSETYITDQQLK